jgi:hypothetical protein
MNDRKGGRGKTNRRNQSEQRRKTASKSPSTLEILSLFPLLAPVPSIGSRLEIGRDAMLERLQILCRKWLLGDMANGEHEYHVGTSGKEDSMRRLSA